jgi:S-adenosylmethionine:tRNA ribosyltransferase-isomerase
MEKFLRITDYQYHLPDDRIAAHPLPQRDQSKLLVYQGGQIAHHIFTDLPSLLPPGALLVFNNTKVIPARLLFEKNTGAVIEVFLLEPVLPFVDIHQAMTATETTTWQCTIGNLKRWKEGQSLQLRVEGIDLTALLIDRQQGRVQFTWTPGNRAFAEIVTMVGKIPLPPYIKRAATDSDRDRYQTVYARQQGAVAAPTAGLHFTPAVLDALAAQGTRTDFLTLHVGAGTFQPVKTANALAHPMHEEQLVITEQNLKNLIAAPVVIPVGTTSMRVIESLYWYGVKLQQQPEAPFVVGQRDPYETTPALTKEEALTRVLERLRQEGASALKGRTSIYIHPGYRFRISHALVTNFHQPGSTLMLLVAALVGDRWKEIYAAALANQYRFLSYGDSSLLFADPMV